MKNTKVVKILFLVFFLFKLGKRKVKGKNKKVLTSGVNFDNLTMENIFKCHILYYSPDTTKRVVVKTPTHPKLNSTYSKSAISQMVLTRFWRKFKGRFLWVTFVRATFVLATFVHIRNISSVTETILTKF